MSNAIALSGGFDPIHPGHIEMIQLAGAFARPVIVILNSDAWLIRKKGYYLQSWVDRRKILLAIRLVTNVVAVDDSDGTVCAALRELMPAMFGNGGDRIADNTPELALCHELGIQPIFSLGNGKIASSSDMVKRAFELMHK